MTGRLHVLGVRHHSPACARLVASTLVRLRPAVVLIEGPADLNDRLDELLLPHRLPIAVFTHRRGEGDRTESSWTPFCEYSPEWQALQVGRALGAELRFMDLPAWHPAFHGVANRYGDHARRHSQGVAALCERFHLEGYDALWDHLFEGACQGEADEAALGLRLQAYFTALRGDGRPEPRDAEREGYMRAWVRAALASTEGPVAVVCGGYHAPALADAEPAEGPGWPEIPSAEGAHSYLVPWSFRRLDSFTGYESGMPSPAFYDLVFAHGAAGAAEPALRLVVEHLREKGQPVSSADLVAAQTLAHGLARLRGHDCLRRTDLLDGLSAALVKESLDAPLPWSERGTVKRGTDALLVEVLRALSGRRKGRLDPGTPRPALLADVAAALEELGLTPGPATRTVELSLAQERDLARSRVLHRLRVLGIPGFRRESGPAWTTDAVLAEQWVIAPDDLAESALIEAAGFGASLAAAAGRKLEEALLAERLDLSQLAALLGEAVFVGLDGLTARALEEVRRHAAREPDFGRLGEALARLLGVFTQDALFGARGRPELATAIAEAFTRGVWLLENLAGTGANADERAVRGVAALRDAARLADRLGLSEQEAADVFQRRSGTPDAPADVRGACLGALWSLGRLGDGQAAAAAAVRGAALPATLGDFLLGLFALAREETVHGDAVLRAVDDALGGLTEPDFLVAAPALRLAFSFFPPREKSAVARTIAGLHGREDQAAGLLSRLGAPLEEVARGRRLDEAVQAALVRWGLTEPEGDAP